MLILLSVVEEHQIERQDDPNLLERQDDPKHVGHEFDRQIGIRTTRSIFGHELSIKKSVRTTRSSQPSNKTLQPTPTLHISLPKIKYSIFKL